MDGNDGAPATEKYERTLFVIDISKLKKEDDQLVNAKLVFRPEEKYQKNEQLCSQLIGLSVCTSNLTGQYPKYLKLRGSGYAIKALGEDCIMGLSTLPTSLRGGNEPVSSVVQALKLIHDLFVFFYHSPDMVKKQAGEMDWTVICASMSAIFSNILAYVEHESKSIFSMLNPLSYGKYTMQQSIEARLFLLSSRLLKHCQQMQPSINAGCIFHCNKIFCSHLPTSLTEKLLLLVHTKTKDMYIELNLKPLFAEEISGHVWMIPVYLLLAEEEELKTYRRNTSDRDSVYNTLRSTTDAIPFSSGAAFFARFTSANPPRASKKSGPAHSKSQGSPPQASAKRAAFRRSMDVDRTYEDVADMEGVVEVLKQSKLQSGEKVTQSGSKTPPPPSLPPRTKGAVGATPLSRIQSGNTQVSTPEVQPSRKTSGHGATPSDSTPTPGYDAVLSGNRSVASTPQSGERGLNTTAYYSPNESFSQTSLGSSKYGPPGTPVGSAATRGPPAKPPASRDADDDFMDASEIENMIRSKNREHALSDLPPPRMGDYENSDNVLLAGGTNKENALGGSVTPKRDSEDVSSQEQPPPIVPRQASRSQMVSPPRSSVDTGFMYNNDNGSGSVVTSDGGGVRGSAGSGADDRNDAANYGSGLQKAHTHHESSREVINGVTVDGPCSNTTDSCSLQTGAVAQLGLAGVDGNFLSDSTPYPDGAREGGGFPVPQEEVLLDMGEDCPIPTPSNSASSYVEAPSEITLVQPQVALDMEERRTGAEDGEYGSPMGSEEEEEENEYVPSWQTKNREWELAKPGSLNEEERARLKEEEVGLKEEEVGFKEEEVGLKEDRSADAKEGNEEEEEEEVVPKGEGEQDVQMGLSPDHKISPPVAHVLHPVARTGEGCGIHAVPKYLFLQNYMNTTVVLLADEGLRNERDQLRELFTTLLVHQRAIEETLTQHSEVVVEDKLPASRAMYRSVDRKCETVGSVGHGQFRHALRRAHHEYQHDPSLLQISMSKDGRTTLSRCVLGREVYVHCKRNQSEDALQTLPTVENMIRGGRGGSRDEDGSEPHGFFL